MAPPRQSKVNADRRARVEAMRREQQRRERRVRIGITAGGVVIGAAILAVIIVTAVHNKSPVGREVLPAEVDTTVAPTIEPPVKVIPDTSGIKGVVAYDVSGHVAGSATSDGSGLPYAHVDGTVTYNVTPPVGGNHNGTWMNCGVYDSPVVTERAVHNLEHGAVWITYEPGLPAAQVSLLKALALKQPKEQPTNASGQQDPTNERFMDLTPWKDDSIGAPIVISSWGHQLKVTSASDPRLQAFITAFRLNPKTTPELAASCSGVPVSLGGNPIAS